MQALKKHLADRSLWREYSAPFIPDIPLSFPDFLDTYYYLSSESNAGYGKWECLPYQRGMCYIMADLDIKRVGIAKCAQIGYTTILRGLVGYECAHRNRNICIWQPTDDLARQFSSVHIKSMLRDSPDIAKFLRVDHDKRDTQNTTSRKVWKGGISYFRGATSAKNFRMLDTDTAANDEISGMDASVEGEGSPDSLAWSRTFASSQPKMINGSTCTIANECNVTRICSDISEKFKRELPCVHCQKFQELKWGGSEARFGIIFDKCQTHELTSKTARYKCEHCAEEFGYESLREMDEKGEWRSENYRLTDKGEWFCRNTGGPTIPPVEAAIYIKGLMSYTLSWEDGVYQFLKATDAARQGDNGNLTTWTNEYLGEPYTPSQNRDLATWEDVKGRKVEESLIPNWATHLTQWGDVQKDSIHLLLVAWGEGERSFCVKYTVKNGDPVSGDLLNLVYQESQKEFRREDGTLLPISLSGIDSGYLTDSVYSACKADPTKIFATKGLSIYGKPVIEMPNRPNQRGVYVCPIGTDTAKDIISERLKIDIEGPGMIQFSAHEGFKESFFKGATSNVKKTVYRSGKAAERWTLPSGRNDEELDCLVGNLGMAKLLQNRFQVEFGTQPEQEQEAEETTMISKLSALARA